jgi:hypothetical protein
MTNDKTHPEHAGEKRPEYFWLWVMCLLGVDYFSTLAYQPTITFEAAGLLGPLATVFVVLATVFGALPVYYYVAGRSSKGQGSIALVERVVHGWRGKTLILILLGFAATDFTMLKTISIADAAVHVVQNDYAPWQETLNHWSAWASKTSLELFGDEMFNSFVEHGFASKQLIVTLLLGLLGFIFWYLLRKGFNRNVIVVAVPLVAVYLALNALVIGSGVAVLSDRPELLDDWSARLHRGEWETAHTLGSDFGWFGLAIVCLVFFPQLSLGLSGFELSLILMPQVKVKSAADKTAALRLRIRNTRKVLIVAAVVMSLYLLSSVLVTALLIPPEAMREGGPAANRALAYLAHGGKLTVADSLHPWFGPVFGTLYDVTTILMLALAGTSVMTALAVLLPRFMMRFGMEMKWTQRWSVLLILFAVINLVITLWFRASVPAQRGAYATGVLVLITCASLVTVLDKRGLKRRKNAGEAVPRSGLVWPYYFITGLFLATTLVVIARAPSGVLIAAGFVGTILGLSVFSRFIRADELRTSGFDFKNDESKFLWDSLRLADFPALIPHRPGRIERDWKETQIRHDHQIDPNMDIVFLEVELEDPSDFFQRIVVEVFREGSRFVIKLVRCVSIAQAIAAVALEMSRDSKPPVLHFGWSETPLMAASWSYFAFGEGNVPWKVHELLARAEPNPDKRPRVVIG